MDLANGRYKGKAKQWAMAETSAGNPQVAVLFELLDEGHVGTQLTWYGFFTDKTFSKTIEQLRTCGWKGTDLSEIESPDCGLDANEVSLVVQNEQKQDKDGNPESYEDGTPVMYPRIRWVNDLGGAGLTLKTPMQGDKLKAFAASMKGRILAAEQNKQKGPVANGTKPTPNHSGPPTPPPLTDADIPF